MRVAGFEKHLKHSLKYRRERTIPVALKRSHYVSLGADLKYHFKSHPQPGGGVCAQTDFRSALRPATYRSRTRPAAWSRGSTPGSLTRRDRKSTRLNSS